MLNKYVFIACALLLAGRGMTAEEPAPMAQERLPLTELRLFTQVFEQIRRGYVDEVSDTQLLENAIAGLLLELDPHSVYLNEEDYGELQEDTSGEYGGLGIEVGADRGLIRVIAPIDGGPAEKAGMQAGDLILELDDAPVRGMPLQKAIDNLRGPKGSKIKLTVLRDGADAPLEFDLQRDIIRISSVRSRELGEGFGYLRISQFQVNTGEDFRAAVDKLQKAETLRGLVIDLRNNPGGVVAGAVDVSDALLDGGTVVYTEGRLPSANRRFEAESGDLLAGLPIVVLINGGSASASEIVAGALQDHRRALILGTRSFGKGSVQTVIPLGDGRAVKLTTSRYYTPGGRSIQAQGIVPDIVVEAGEVRKYEAGYSVREADLAGHLENEKRAGENASGVEGGESEDVSADSQLFEALNILKGISLWQRKPLEQNQDA